MGDFVLWVRRVSLAFAIVALAAGASWADEPYHDGDDDSLEAPQMEDQHQGGDDPAPNPAPQMDPDPAWIAVGNPPAGNPPGNPPAGPPITVDDQGNPLVTPEPATLVLLTTGAAGTVIARWRKRGR
jgi:hypothetical protein